MNLLCPGLASGPQPLKGLQLLQQGLPGTQNQRQCQGLGLLLGTQEAPSCAHGLLGTLLFSPQPIHCFQRCEQPVLSSLQARGTQGPVSLGLVSHREATETTVKVLSWGGMFASPPLALTWVGSEPPFWCSLTDFVYVCVCSQARNPMGRAEDLGVRRLSSCPVQLCPSSTSRTPACIAVFLRNVHLAVRRKHAGSSGTGGPPWPAVPFSFASPTIRGTSALSHPVCGKGKLARMESTW